MERDHEEVAVDLSRQAIRSAEAGDYETASLLGEAAEHIRALAEEVVDDGYTGCRSIREGALCMDNDPDHPMPHYNPILTWRDES